jgi:hypothetical protein
MGIPPEAMKMQAQNRHRSQDDSIELESDISMADSSLALTMTIPD